MNGQIECGGAGSLIRMAQAGSTPASDSAAEWKQILDLHIMAKSGRQSQ
jgi:hypothetical protein